MLMKDAQHHMVAIGLLNSTPVANRTGNTANNGSGGLDLLFDLMELTVVGLSHAKVSSFI